MEKDIRWEQRFSNYNKALYKLTQAIDFVKKDFEESEYDDEQIENVANEIIKEGLIQRFEYTYELAWNVMRDYASFQGNTNVGGSRDAIKEAFQLKLIKDGKVWMDMIGSRNETAHTYNEKIANEIYFKIIKNYYPAFQEFQILMEEKRSGRQGEFL